MPNLKEYKKSNRVRVGEKYDVPKDKYICILISKTLFQTAAQVKYFQVKI